MKFLQNFVDKTWGILLSLAGALCVLLPTSPWNMPLTLRDSGVFLYFGWRILEGEVPYRDIWDHKPPVIFYINALGHALTGDSRWGVWLIELLLLIAAAYLGYLLVKKAFGVIPAIFSLLLWLLSLVFFLQGGNFTTEYTLPLQFAALWLIHHADQSSRPARNFFLIGLTGAVAFFTKQTTVGVWIAIVLYLTFQRLSSKQGRQWIHDVFYIALGGLTFTALVLVYFGIHMALPQLWDAAFGYNFVYASREDISLTARLEAILRDGRPLTWAGLFQMAMIGYAISLGMILFRRNAVEKVLPLLAVGLLALPIEIILIGISGILFPHYYLTLLPVLALFAGAAIWGIGSLLPKWDIPDVVRYILVLIVAGYIAWDSFSDYMDQLYLYRTYTRREDVVEYITANTSPNDRVLLWGAETYINYFARRRSPTRFVYQYPLYEEGYADETMINEFLDDLIRNRPKLVIDTDTLYPLFEFPFTTKTIEEKSDYLKSHYCQVRRMDTWTIYAYSEEECTR